MILKIKIRTIVNSILMIGVLSSHNAMSQAYKLEGLKIGDQVPDVLLDNVQNFKSKSARLSDFRGKLLIIDFWATWCAPCRAMIPKMEVLQKQFEGKVQFLAVTYQTQDEVKTFKIKSGIKLDKFPEINNDKILEKLFPHRELPHYVWIDTNGVVGAITEGSEVNALNISDALKSNSFKFLQKTDMFMPYAVNKPFLINGNGGSGEGIIAHSLLTKYIDGLHGGITVSKPDEFKGQQITARNVNLLWLFRLAYGNGSQYPLNSIIFNVRDSTKLLNFSSGQKFKDWLKAGNGYCYELIMPPYLMTRAYQLMQEDMKRYFPSYKIEVKFQKRKCLALVRTSTQDKLMTKGGISKVEVDPFTFNMHNGFMSQLLIRLVGVYMQNSPIPIVDETGYLQKADMEIHASLSDKNAVNKELEKYDLKLIEKISDVKMLVIEDI